MYGSNDDGCLFFIIFCFICAAALGIGGWELAKYIVHHLHVSWN